MLRPYEPSCRRSAVQQRTQTEPESPVAVVTDQVGLVRRGWHEVHAPIDPKRNGFVEPVAQADEASDAAVLRLVAARALVLHIAQSEKQLVAADRRHFVDGVHVERR